MYEKKYGEWLYYVGAERNILNTVYGMTGESSDKSKSNNDISKPKMTHGCPGIKKVIFNDPATIVLWDDGTKTVVKCFEGDVYTKWAGFAFCICKKMMGDNFHKDFRRWCGEDEIRSPIEESSEYGSSVCNDLTGDFINNFRELFFGKNPTKDI